MNKSLEKITNIVIETVRNLGDEKDNRVLINANDETGLYGSEGEMDSLTLVLLVSNVEERVFEEFGESITLADERAMSQKHSPFRNVKSLSEYINNLLNNEN